MKIAIDCADLDYSRIDGTKVYIKQLLNYFGELGGRDEFFLFHNKEYNPLLKPRDFPNYYEKKVPYPLYWTQTRFAYELRRLRPDVCWMPIQQLPFLGIADKHRKTKYVVTIHDLAFKYFPSHFPWRDRKKHEFFTRHAIKNADRVIAISEATRNDILKFYPKTDKSKIKVVYHGFDESFAKKFSDLEIGKVLEKYKIKNKRKDEKEKKVKYLLYVGVIQPRKNLITLIEAFEKLKSGGIVEYRQYADRNYPLSVSPYTRERSREKYRDLKLVFAGEAAWKAEKTLSKVKNSEFSKDIILTGKVDFSDLGKLYQAAEVFVLPSLYEGFGIPVLEAFTSGVPVVVADNSSLSEIGGSAVEKFDGKSSEELKSVLEKILNSKEIRKEMIGKGKERARDFSWKKCAKETLVVLKNCE